MTPIHQHLDERAMRCFVTRVFAEPNTGCHLWGMSVGARGYGRFRLAGHGVLAHRVALTHKLGRDVQGLVLHSCDNRACVNPDHLREGTDADNTRDKVARGRCVAHKNPNATGSFNHRAKLTEADVVAIRSLAGSVSQRELALRYGVSRQVVGRIVRREKWRHV